MAFEPQFTARIAIACEERGSRQDRLHHLAGAEAALAGVAAGSVSGPFCPHPASNTATPASKGVMHRRATLVFDLSCIQGSL